MAEGNNDLKYYAFLVTYNRSERLAGVIDHILGQSIPPYLLIIINNNSTDKTEEVLENYKAINITILNSGNNIGHGAALALGFKHYLDNYYKEDDILMLFEDDSKPSKELFEYMSKPYVEGNLKFLCLDGFLLSIGKRKEPIIPINGLAEVDFGLLDGCLINSMVIKEVGTPVENWFMMYDDLEFCRRIKEHGYKIFCIVNKFHKIDHSGASSLWRPYYQSRNHVHYLRKYFSLWELSDFTVIELKRCFGHIMQRDWRKLKFRIYGLVAGMKGIKGKSLDPSTLKFLN